MRIAVTYDAVAAGGPPDAAGVMDAVWAVVESLVRLGHAAFPVAVGRPYERLLARLDAVDLVFNLTEGLAGRGEGESRAAALQELSGRPVTGDPSAALALGRRKARVNGILGAEGLPVPPWIVAAPGSAPGWRRFPAIVKPLDEDGSIGIGDDPVVHHPWELREALAGADGSRMVQAFVGGREFNVGIVGSRVLPVSEIVFSGSQRVVSYAAKWNPGSTADCRTTPICPARITVTLHDRLVELGRAAWRAVGGRGYGRIDLRLDERGEPFVLEVNPNPDLAPAAGLARMAAAAGWGYDGLVARIVEEGAP